MKKKWGREEAKEVAKAIELSLETIEKKAEAVILQKKLEIRDELTKELASKADLLVLEERFNVKIEQTKSEIIKWMFLFWIGQLASLVAILQIFFGK